MEIYILDVGQTKYGDCLLLVRGSRKILIDAGHPGDTDRIAAQLKKVLNQDAPFKLDLLVVTHCHSDHIGCMPRLVSDGTITANWALVADEALGFGRDSNDDSPIDAIASPTVRSLAYALQEEPADNLDDAALAQFIEDAATLESKYAEMLEALENAGTNVVRYGKASAAEVQAVESAFADFGFKILGPTSTHLAICAAVIASSVDAVSDALSGNDIVADDIGSIAAAYRRAVDAVSRPFRATSSDLAIEDRPGVGAAKNDQSIVIRVAADGWRALLTGDMQFAEPEVSGLDTEMRSLRDAVKADISSNGAYDLVKLSHHSSYNGLDQSVLDEWSGTTHFVHTGGRNDTTHPDPGVLDLLEAKSDDIWFARTDRNGLITVKKSGADVDIEVARGNLNNFAKNRVRRRSPDAPAAPTPAELEQEQPSPPSGRDYVEVVTRVPHEETTVTVTIQVDPKKKRLVSRPASVEGSVGKGFDRGNPLAPLGGQGVALPRAGTIRLGGGRAITQRLLFVTQRSQLERNIGKQEAVSALTAIVAAGQRLLELPHGLAVDAAVAAVRRELKSARYEGIVLVGGYDVVPSARLDVLDAKLRATISNLGLLNRDSDQFIVWSDSLYGDMDGDTVAELPVSRIPDGRRADVLLAALQSPAASRTARGGVRNDYRPFADAVYGEISKRPAAKMLVSKPASPATLAGTVDLTSDTYYMLHGSDHDATRFWGEDAPQSIIEAVDLQNVPRRAPGAVVFSGCCWGALTVTPAAAKLRPGVELKPRGPESSIAIAYLQAGALAFVGCTGTHYSPIKPVPPAGLNFFGKPLHDAFWANVNAGKSPAQALFDAKVTFARQMPHGPDDPFSRAIEMKILREFTVLGLGW